MKYTIQILLRILRNKLGFIIVCWTIFLFIGPTRRTELVHYQFENSQTLIAQSPEFYTERTRMVTRLIPETMGAARDVLALRWAALPFETVLIAAVFGTLLGAGYGARWRFKELAKVGHIKPSSTRVAYGEYLLRGSLEGYTMLVCLPVAVPFWVLEFFPIFVFTVAFTGMMLMCRYFAWWM